MAYKQVKYEPINPEKYLGDIDKLICKSSWEDTMFKFCDNNINVLSWGYEIIPIRYAKPVENGFKPSIYYPDIYLEYINKDEEVIREIIEIKPNKQTKKSRSKKPLQQLAENYVLKVNMAKWDAAQRWCDKHNIKFSIYTEKSIFGKKSNK